MWKLQRLSHKWTHLEGQGKSGHWQNPSSLTMQMFNGACVGTAVGSVVIVGIFYLEIIHEKSTYKVQILDVNVRISLMRSHAYF